MQPAPGSPVSSATVTVDAADVALSGDLTVPPGAAGVVVFAHGTGSSRLSPRNRAVAGALVDDGFATLLLDLLTRGEEAADRRTGHLRFDIPLLAGRLIGAVDWVVRQGALRGLPIGLFGASTGAAAALIAASRSPVRAVVSRGGRPDLAGDALARVRCPTLLIVGGADTGVIALNRRALQRLPAAVIHIVPDAGHLFEEPGALAEVVAAASQWFRGHLAR